nr:3-ketoacyl-CoA synthase 5-like [Ipomoea batatas]
MYVVDYVCFKPPNFCRIPFSSFLEHTQMMGDSFNSKGVAFMEKIMNLSGLSEQTYWPPEPKEVSNAFEVVNAPDPNGKVEPVVADEAVVAEEAKEPSFPSLSSSPEKCKKIG